MTGPGRLGRGEPTRAEVREELRFHVAERARELIEQGMAEEEAVAEALRAFGDPGRIEEEIVAEAKRMERGEARRLRMGGWVSDARSAARSLLRNPGFAMGVAALLAVGIGAATTVFAVVDAVVLRPLPYPDPDALVELENGYHSPADFVIWEDEVVGIAEWGATFNDQADLTGDGPPQRVSLSRVTADFFGVLGAEPAVGRLFRPEEFGPDPDVLVLSHDYWVGRWGGDRELVGRELRVGARVMTVVGVLSPGFDPLTLGPADPQLWTPIDIDEMARAGHGQRLLKVVGRLAPDTDVRSADQEMQAMSESFRERGIRSYQMPDGSTRQVPVVPLRDQVVGEARTTGWIMLGSVGFLLLIACANAASLFLARGARRVREMSLKLALGAGRMRLVRQLVAESLVLAAMGGALGVAVSLGGTAAFRALEPGVLNRTAYVQIDARVLGFALAVSLLTGLVFGTLPALRASRADPATALKASTGKSTGGRAATRARSAMVAAQVALSTVLLAGAGILFHSFLVLAATETGFDRTERVIAADLQLMSPYGEESRRLFLDDVIERLRRSVPGATEVFAAPTLPFQWVDGMICCSRTSARGEVGEVSDVLIQPVTSDYWSGLGIEIVAGSPLMDGDEDRSPLPAVVDRSTARALFGVETPIGERIALVGGAPVEIVGIAEDVRHGGLDRDLTPTVYLPWAARGPRIPVLTLGVRTSAPLEVVGPLVREAIWAVAPDLPVPSLSTMEDRIAGSLADERFISVLFASFAVVAGLLATGGLYGSLLYIVRQRDREMGVRVAVGAHPSQLVGMVLLEGLRVASLGVAVGAVGVWIWAGLLESYVFEISPRDPLAIGVVAVLLLAVATVACLAPALRAGAVEPMATLRTE